jgi:putative peptidoglycan lipid II flippase
VLVLLGGIGDGAFPVSGPVGGVVSMAVAGASMALVYLGILWLTRNPELRAFATPITARLRRR